MIELGDAVQGGDRCLPVDFPAQFSHSSRKLLQFDPLQHLPRGGPRDGSAGPHLNYGSPPSSIAGMRSCRQAWAPFLSAGLCVVAGGCSGLPHDVGLAERCADIMRRAYPSAAIDVTKNDASATSLTTIVARAEGVRTDTPPGAPMPRELAVECQFDQNILTGFRWTAGPSR